jgi:hypothetical protein
MGKNAPCAPAARALLKRVGPAQAESRTRDHSRAMSKDQLPYGHADALNEMTRPPSGATCGAVHPLLAGVSCVRLPGHPGKHGAVADTDATELTLEWED